MSPIRKGGHLNKAGQHTWKIRTRARPSSITGYQTRGSCTFTRNKFLMFFYSCLPFCSFLFFFLKRREKISLFGFRCSFCSFPCCKLGILIWKDCICMYFSFLLLLFHVRIISFDHTFGFPFVWLLLFFMFSSYWIFIQFYPYEDQKKTTT